MSDPIRFAMIGGGWRAEFFFRIVRELPERFQCTGALVRNAEKGARLEAEFGIPTHRTLDEMLAARPLFTVVSVPWSVSPPMLRELSDRGVPALAETPPAPDLSQLVEVFGLVARGGRIQVAEQYHLQPLHAARIALANSGRLGRVSQAQVSVCHGYHGISVIRRLLRVTFEDVTITARRFVSPIVESPGREGPPTHPKTVESSQTIAQLDFGDRLGVFDFTGDQYFSWIRGQRVLVRGDRGEIIDDRVRYLDDAASPVSLRIERQSAGEFGNLEGYYLKGLTAGADWIYRNPFVPGRMTDDEIAVASCLEGMAIHARGGPDFYSLAEASQDHYLSLLIDQAVKSGEPVRSERQSWAS